MQIHYYYDGEAKELRPAVEGTPLRHVLGLRDVASGTLRAFSADGYETGLLSDNGQFTPIAPELAGKRHISQFGSEFKIVEKPVMLQAPPTLPPLAKTFVDLYRGSDEKPLFFGSTEVIAVQLVNAIFVYFGPLISLELFEVCSKAKNCIIQHKSFELSECVYRDGKAVGRVFIRPVDLHRIVFALDPIREKEVLRGA